MRVIDLLNRIANNGVSDEIQHIKYFDRIVEENDICMLCYENLIYKLNCGQLDINDEVEIIEEEKKIPEKLGYQDNADGTFYLNRKKYNSEPIKILSKKINEIIDYLDYLKNKGE